jgi:hypothetical protein
LKRLQGAAIPVYIWNIDLPKICWMDVSVLIQHMMLISWVGEEAGLEREHHLRPWKRRCSERELVHGEIRVSSILWS